MNNNVEPFECLVRKEAIMDYQSGHNEYLSCVAFGVKTLAGHPLYWIIQLNNGILYHPILTSALCWRPCSALKDTETERWDNPSYQSEVITFDWLAEQQMDVTLPDKTTLKGRYWFSIDFYGTEEAESGSNIGHKHKHFIKLNNGNFCAYPNTYIRGYTKCFTDSTETITPNVATKAWNADVEGSKTKGTNNDRQ